MKYNYKKQQAIRERERIRTSDLTDTAKKRLFRNLDTAIQYEESDTGYNSVPSGLVSDLLSDPILIQDALKEVDSISEQILKDIGDDASDKVSNLRFAINTPYFTRNADDPFPLFQWDDPLVNNLTECVSRVLAIYGREFESSLNIIVRRYRRGDNLKFHTDRKEFGEQIFGMVLENLDSDRGLILNKNSHSYMLPESPGFCWMLTGDARWEYEHGYCTYYKGCRDIPVRTSITFRYFRE